jgi:hypothetical protein
VSRKVVYAQAGFSDVTRIELWTQGVDLGAVEYPGGAELFVLDGAFRDETGQHGAGTWLRFPVGGKHHPRVSGASCTLYTKTGGLQYLR